MPNTFIGNFSLSFTKALRDQLIQKLDMLTPAALCPENLAEVAKLGGVYQLFHDSELVYVGKSTKNLNNRLLRHYRKIGGRQGGLTGSVSFKCVYVDEDLDAVAPEKMLIDLFRKRGLAKWNANGFGSNDPGRQRDHSRVEDTHFDAQYPIDLDSLVKLERLPNSPTVFDIFNELKSELPFVFRFDSKASKQLRNSVNKVQGEVERTVRDWLDLASSEAPSHWATVALPGYVISYPHMDPNDYKHRIESWKPKSPEDK